MEGSVWTQLSALAAAIASLLSSLLKNLPSQSSGGESQNVPKTAADLTSTSTNVTNPILRIKRDPAMATMAGVSGNLTFKDGWSCFTLENQALIIPAGIYGLEIYDSPHAGHLVPRLQNVSGRSEIEIHCGNVPQDSKGCILVGLDRTGDTIERSQDAFNILFPKIRAALQEGPQTIEIVG